MAKKGLLLYGLRGFFISLLFPVGILSLSAQELTGVITGHITDGRDKEPLIGATVVVRDGRIGAVTDMDGAFRIEGLLPGHYNISASYVSYQAGIVDDVSVVAGGETSIDIALLDRGGQQLKDVTVVAQRRLNSETAVMSEVRHSLPVASGISAQQIGRTQDSDAAQALSRVPGITLVDSRFIVVRGLAQRYNDVWMNGATTPSGETDSRAFSFDLLPSSLIDNIMVFKSPSAELPSDFSGGFVRISTRNIPEGNTLHVTYQTGYNANATLRNFSLAGGTGFADYAGFGASGRKLPSNMPPLGEVSAAEAAAFTRQTNKGWGVSRFTALPEQKLSVTLNRSFDIGDMRIGNVTNFNYSTGYDYYETENNNYLSYDMKNKQSSYRFRYDDVQYKNTVKLGALFNWSLVTDRSKIELHNFFNQRGTASLHQRQGTDYYSDEDIRRWESIYTQRTTYSGQLGGNHRLGSGEEGGRVEWTAGYAYAAYDEPDRRDVKSVLHTIGGQKRYYVSDPTRYYQELGDHSVSFATNYENRFKLSDVFAPELHAGVYGEYKDRYFKARRFVYNLLGNGYDRYADWDYTSVFSDENISADRIYMKESTNRSDSYASDRYTGTAYLALKLNYGPRFNLNAGLRMEYYGLKLDGYEADGVKPVTIDESATDYFPSLNMAYNFSDRHLLRLAFGRSVNRPEFREIVPYVYYDFGMNVNISGMPGLKNSYICNLDLRYEFYPSESEAIMAGIFYKRFDSPIEQTYNEAGSGLQYTFHNAGQAEAYGLEVDVRKQLLKGLSLVFNGAYICSQVHFAEGSFERDRPMQGQSPYLVNMGLFYRHDERGFSASLLYNRIGRRIESVGVPMQNPNDDIPDIYEMPRNSLDLSFSVRIGRNAELRGGIKDVFNSKVEYKQFLSLTDPSSGCKYEEVQLVRCYRPGMTVNVGVSVKF
jgi:hypothetical protein